MGTPTQPRVDVYLNYPGHCEQAFRFYAEQLGGTLLSMMKHGEAHLPGHVPDHWKQAVLHARLEIGNLVIMGADIPGAEPMRSAYITLRFNAAAETERVYNLLSENGEIFMQLHETFFADRFAMLRDRFGTSWMLLCEKQSEQA